MRLLSNSHARVARLVNDDSLARLVHIVVHAKVCGHPVQQHAVVRGHLGKLLILVTASEKTKGQTSVHRFLLPVDKHGAMTCLLR